MTTAALSWLTVLPVQPTAIECLPVAIDNEISMAQLLGRLLRIFLDRNDPLGEEMRKRMLGKRES